MSAEQPTPEYVNGYELIDNYNISDEEIAFIESTELKLDDLKKREELNKELSAENDKGISLVKNEAMKLLNKYDGKEIKASDVQGLQTLLRLSQKGKEGKVVNIDANAGSLPNLFDNDLNKYVAQRDSLKPIVGENGIKILDEVMKYNKDNFMEQSNYDRIVNGKFEAAENDVYNIDKKEAATFLKQYFDNNFQGADPTKFYSEMMKGNTKLAKEIIASVQSLLGVEQTGEFPDPNDKDAMKNWSNIIENFQKEHQDSPIFAEYKKDRPNLRIVDGKLGIMTIRALIDASERYDGINTYEKQDDITITGNADRKVSEEIDMDHRFIKNNTAKEAGGRIYSSQISELGTREDGVYKLNDGQEGVDGKGRKFISIDGKRYITEGDTAKGENSFKSTREQIGSYFDDDGNEIPLYETTTKLGELGEDEKVLNGQEIISKGDKQKKAIEFKSRDEDGKSRIGTVRVGNDIEDGVFKGKWRIDLFDNSDSKRLNDKQLDSLDAADLSYILQQAIDAYTETNHKPSEVGRYNLNRIVYNIIHKTEKFDNLGAAFDTPKTVSHIILGMDTGFFSNPSKPLEEKDISTDDTKLLNALGMDKAPDGLTEINYGESTKCDQITNRLRILKAFVESKDNAEKLNKKQE